MALHIERNILLKTHLLSLLQVIASLVSWGLLFNVGFAWCTNHFCTFFCNLFCFLNGLFLLFCMLAERWIGLILTWVSNTDSHFKIYTFEIVTQQTKTDHYAEYRNTSTDKMFQLSDPGLATQYIYFSNLGIFTYLVCK